MSKNQSFKRKSAIILSENIFRRGIIIISCDSCRESGFECRIFVWFKKCGYCIRRGIKCNAVEVFLSDFVKIEKERFCINNKLRAIRALLFENFVKINYFEKQQAFLRKRKGEMVRRGVENIKTLEKLKEKKCLFVTWTPWPVVEGPRYVGRLVGIEKQMIKVSHFSKNWI